MKTGLEIMSKRPLKSYAISLLLVFFVGIGTFCILSLTMTTSRLPAPTPNSVSNAPPSPEEILAQYESQVQPLVQELESKERWSCDFDLPPEDELYITLIPFNKRLYYPQEVLFPDLSLGDPAALTKLYVAYDYARGTDLSTMYDGAHWIKYKPSALSGETPDTQEVFIQVTLFAQREDRLCILEQYLGSAGAGERSFHFDTRHRDLVKEALPILREFKTHQAAIRSTINGILCYTTGIDFYPSLTLSRRLALIEWALGSPYWSDREQATSTLGLKGPATTPSVALLIQTLQIDESPTVRRSTNWALQSITGEDFGTDYTAWQEWWETQ